MAEFNWFDYTIITIFLFSILAGLSRGIVKEVLSLIAWVVAFVVSCMFANKLASVFTGSSHVQSAIMDSSNAVGMSTAQPITLLSLGMSFVCLFLVTLIIGTLITNVISGAVNSAGMGLANRLFGGIFGLLRGFLINLVFVFIIQLTTFDEESWWKESRLVPLFQPTAAWIGNFVHPGFESLKVKVGKSLKDAAESMMGGMYQYRG